MNRVWPGALVLLAAPAFAQVAVHGETVYTMAGAPLKDGIVVIKDGKIDKVGRAGEVAVPAGYRTLEAKVVTPGLIDAHSVIGLSGYLNPTTRNNSRRRHRYSRNFAPSMHTTPASAWSNGCGGSGSQRSILGTLQGPSCRARP
jgi:predicted amidohydrolase YtcJ